MLVFPLFGVLYCKEVLHIFHTFGEFGAGLVWVVAGADEMLGIHGQVKDGTQSLTDVLRLVKPSFPQSARVQRNRYQQVDVGEYVGGDEVACRLFSEGEKDVGIRVQTELTLLYQSSERASAHAVVVSKSRSALVTDDMFLVLDKFGKEHVNAVIVDGGMFRTRYFVETVLTNHLLVLQQFPSTSGTASGE